ncbi:hypothetical protein U1Q18_041205 [Sarracenia purpurea var. burkii]
MSPSRVFIGRLSNESGLNYGQCIGYPGEFYVPFSYMFVGRLSNESGLNYKHVESGHLKESSGKGWYCRVCSPGARSKHNPKVEPITENGNAFPETKSIPTENGSLLEIEDKDVGLDGLGSVNVCDQWVRPPVADPRLKARYKVLAFVAASEDPIPFPIPFSSSFP